ncbi:putative lipoprotein [Corallococcus coralloides DSM 2259]|uniref:Putative lipoprotein n=1 Tax=Corallococcus coralloides (strain ATCC 25202 / DSM 2259 / NBRC 100086 / M2) TaxID=1144275 RepID=H8MWQ6_CORCM|nr:hypothetical protein [Corallococcus coralloides]AFE03375.1 putative lipoprotein [Corallococcus coralloides DSM 2259]
MRRALVTSLALLASATTGCQRYPEDPVFVYGRALRRDGTPHSGEPLSVQRMDRETRVFQPFGTVLPEPSGDFTMELLYGEAVSDTYAFRDMNRFTLALPLEEDGSGAFVSFLFQDDVELPTLQPWDAHPTVSMGEQGPIVAFPPAPPAPAQPKTADTMEMQDEATGDFIPLLATDPEPLMWVMSGDELLWRERGMTSPWTPGLYVLEDFVQPRVLLRAASSGTWIYSPLGSEMSSVEFQLEWRTGAEPLPTGTLRPLSRGATCEPSPSGDCPWTDGLLTPVDFPQERATPRAKSLAITLPQPGTPRRAVVRGLSYVPGPHGKDWLVLEGSADGEQWQSLARVTLQDLTSLERNLLDTQFGFNVQSTGDSPYGDGPLPLGRKAPVFQDVPLTGTDPVRFVRLTVETLGYNSAIQPVELRTLSELSIFE